MDLFGEDAALGNSAERIDTDLDAQGIAALGLAAAKAGEKEREGSAEAMEVGIG